MYGVRQQRFYARWRLARRREGIVKCQPASERQCRRNCSSREDSPSRVSTSSRIRSPVSNPAWHPPELPQILIICLFSRSLRFREAQKRKNIARGVTLLSRGVQGAAPNAHRYVSNTPTRFANQCHSLEQCDRGLLDEDNERPGFPLGPLRSRRTHRGRGSL